MIIREICILYSVYKILSNMLWFIIIHHYNNLSILMMYKNTKKVLINSS